MFFKIYLKWSWISDTEYDPWGRSNFSFHVGTDILNSLFFYDFFIFLHNQYMLKFDKAPYLSLLFKFVLSARLINSPKDSNL